MFANKHMMILKLQCYECNNIYHLLGISHAKQFIESNPLILSKAIIRRYYSTHFSNKN